MIAQDFKIFDNNGDGEMDFLLLFYKGTNITAETNSLSMRYGGSITIHECLK